MLHAASLLAFDANLGTLLLGLYFYISWLMGFGWGNLWWRETQRNCAGGFFLASRILAAGRD
jgi:hypothetical protein